MHDISQLASLQLQKNTYLNTCIAYTGCLSQAAPDSWEAFWELSQARFELGDAAGGLLPLDRASALAPGNDEVALTLAEVRYMIVRVRVTCFTRPCRALQTWIKIWAVRGFGTTKCSQQTAGPNVIWGIPRRLRTQHVFHKNVDQETNSNMHSWDLRGPHAEG